MSGVDRRERVERVVERPNTTFKPRRRSLSDKRQAEFDAWITRWGLDENGPALDWPELFGDRPIVVDIGFGRGEGTIDMARADHETAIIGIDVHTPGVVAVLDAVENDPLPHVRVVHGDALRFLTRVPNNSLDAVRVYFPDPWPKKRHHDRRLDSSRRRRRPSRPIAARRHLASRHRHWSLRNQMLATCAAADRLNGGQIERPSWRPVTRFEQRGLDEGRAPIDLLFTRTS